MTKLKIQRVDLDDSGSPIHCPFCGTKITRSYDEANPDGWVVENPCAHTLFAAHDEGFEYRSEAFNKHLETVLARIEDPEEREEIEEGSIDELTDMVEIDNSLKFAVHVPPPAGFGSYVGFAAPESE
ncbi:hypothetical protein [Microvirga massiliensis]|uniref:hypothetical protein n=1 Tax=Microvirga massiliensis TaxID=1033741 RepID=UPI00062BD28F|nr:hypothetical protein [Microvirga massiliensis]